RYSRRPFEKSSATMTRAPTATRRSARNEPIRPAPPVTTTRRFARFIVEPVSSLGGARQHVAASREHILAQEIHQPVPPGEIERGHEMASGALKLPSPLRAFLRVCHLRRRFDQFIGG